MKDFELFPMGQWEVNDGFKHYTDMINWGFFFHFLFLREKKNIWRDEWTGIMKQR